MFEIMKKLLSIFVVAAAAVVVSTALAEDETTVTGDVVCAHCDLKVKTSCQNAIKTADVVYLLEGDVAKTFFKENEDVEKVTATGAVSKDGENEVLTATKIETAEG
jgi:hypothetical protein